jgi:hypothetical protein
MSHFRTFEGMGTESLRETGWGNRRPKQLDWRHISSGSTTSCHSSSWRRTGSNSSGPLSKCTTTGSLHRLSRRLGRWWIRSRPMLKMIRQCPWHLFRLSQRARGRGWCVRSTARKPREKQPGTSPGATSSWYPTHRRLACASGPGWFRKGVQCSTGSASIMVQNFGDAFLDTTGVIWSTLRAVKGKRCFRFVPGCHYAVFP